MFAHLRAHRYSVSGRAAATSLSKGDPKSPCPCPRRWLHPNPRSTRSLCCWGALAVRNRPSPTPQLSDLTSIDLLGTGRGRSVPCRSQGDPETRLLCSCSPWEWSSSTGQGQQPSQRSSLEMSFRLRRTYFGCHHIVPRVGTTPQW